MSTRGGSQRAAATSALDAVVEEMQAIVRVVIEGDMVWQEADEQIDWGFRWRRTAARNDVVG
jgi:hypothetical protein